MSVRFGAVVSMALFVVPLFAFGIEYPQPVGHVTDQAGILSSDERSALESKLVSLKEQTGNEIAILTIQSLEGEPIEDYAVEVFERWGVGQKEKDNGLLIVVARDDRAVRIEVGYGLEGVINDATAGRIIREHVVPAFQRGAYAKGLIDAVNVIQSAIASPTAGERPPVSHEQVEAIGNAFPFILVIFMYVASFLARSKRWWPGGVIGAVGGSVMGGMFGSWIIGGLALGVFGLLLDFLLSKNYQSRSRRGLPNDFWRSGGGFFGGGGFGGFGGGSSGGGGASGRW